MFFTRSLDHSQIFFVAPPLRFQKDHCVISAHALLLRAIELRSENRTTKSVQCLQEALRLDPALARARYELSCTQLLTGNYKDGFASYGSRWEASGLPRPAHTDGSILGEQWRGCNPTGKRILLHAEQGFGDTIQFLRYAPMVAALGAEIVVEVQPELRELATCMLPFNAVGSGVPVGVFDFHSSLMDLPAGMVMRAGGGMLSSVVPNAAGY